MYAREKLWLRDNVLQSDMATWLHNEVETVRDTLVCVSALLDSFQDKETPVAKALVEIKRETEFQAKELIEMIEGFGDSSAREYAFALLRSTRSSYAKRRGA